MAITIEDPEVEQLLRDVIIKTGETPTEAVANSLRERLRGPKRHASPEELDAIISDIQERIRQLPVLDTRTDDEILGYGEDGLPH